ncbi:MAG: hypothetical protein ABI668_07805 [Sphingorhabdus sp.]
MSIFRSAMDRLADFIWEDRKVKLSFNAEYRIACYAAPLITKLLAEGEDGDAYRTALVGWHTAERPPLTTYQGSISRCRIDGPSQVAGQHWIPLGGLILSPGVTAHLDPFEAQALREQMEQAIEGVIRSWVREHSLQSLPPVEEHYDRAKADSKAKAIIADWVAGQIGEDASDSDADDADEAAATFCTLCRKGLGHD